MSRFDLYVAGASGEYLLDLQTDLLDVQSTRMMAPVLPQDAVPQPIRALHPEIEVDGRACVVATHLMGAVPKSALGRPKGNLSDRADDLTRALDLLFQGY